MPPPPQVALDDNYSSEEELKEINSTDGPKKTYVQPEEGAVAASQTGVAAGAVAGATPKRTLQATLSSSSAAAEKRKWSEISREEEEVRSNNQPNINLH